MNRKKLFESEDSEEITFPSVYLYTLDAIQNENNELIWFVYDTGAFWMSIDSEGEFIDGSFEEEASKENVYIPKDYNDFIDICKNLSKNAKKYMQENSKENNNGFIIALVPFPDGSDNYGDKKLENFTFEADDKKFQSLVEDLAKQFYKVDSSFEDLLNGNNDRFSNNSGEYGKKIIDEAKYDYGVMTDTVSDYSATDIDSWF